MLNYRTDTMNGCNRSCLYQNQRQDLVEVKSKSEPEQEFGIKAEFGSKSESIQGRSQNQKLDQDLD